MRGDGFEDAGTPTGSLARLLHGALEDVPAGDIAGEEPRLGLLRSPPVAQDLQQLRGEHDLAILVPLALLDANDHPLAIDRGGLEGDGLGDAEPGGVAGGEDGAMLEAGHATEEVLDLLRTENDGQFLGFLRYGDEVGQVPILVQGDFL